MSLTAINDRAAEVAAELEGTALSLAEVATSEEINDSVFCALLDNHVFCCEVCSWWCEVGDGVDNVCADCAGEEG